MERRNLTNQLINKGIALIQANIIYCDKTLISFHFQTDDAVSFFSSKAAETLENTFGNDIIQKSRLFTYGVDYVGVEDFFEVTISVKNIKELIDMYKLLLDFFGYSSTEKKELENKIRENEDNDFMHFTHRINEYFDERLAQTEVRIFKKVDEILYSNSADPTI